MSKEIHIVDSTLRDGSHAINHQFTRENISEYAKGAELAGIRTLIVGHGNGLGASSYQVGESLLTDQEMLQTAKSKLKKTRLGAFLIPGFGTIKKELEPAIEIGLDDLMVACHCTEANITRQHIEYARSKGLSVYGVLMMAHRLDKEGLLDQAKLMQNYGVSAMILMDSAGAILDDELREKINHLSGNLDIDIGFHAHNNLGLAISNSLLAVDNGAKIIDATSRGMGAGAGNCQMEVLVALLHRKGYSTGLDLYKIIDNSDNIIAKIMNQRGHYQIIDGCSLSSGLAGVFSGFKPHVLKAAVEYNVDPKEIFRILGERGVVAGQEDLIVDVAKGLINDNR